MFICIHTRKENITVYSLKYLTLSVTKPLLSLCTAEYLEHICDPSCHPQLHSAGAAPGLPGLLSLWAAQKQVPGCCPAWAQWFSAVIIGPGVTGWPSRAAAGPWRVGCASETLDQLLWQLSGQQVEWGLCLITSGHNVQQHHIISCCLALFGFQWFILAFLWQMCGSDTHPLPLKARRFYTNDPVRLSRTHRKIALKYSVV